jgi:hypothetical protein
MSASNMPAAVSIVRTPKVAFPAAALSDSHSIQMESLAEQTVAKHSYCMPMVNRYD